MIHILYIYLIINSFILEFDSTEAVEVGNKLIKDIEEFYGSKESN